MASTAPHSASFWDDQRRLEVISTPLPHEGVRRALLGSFRSVPAMPQDFVRLLDRIR